MYSGASGAIAPVPALGLLAIDYPGASPELNCILRNVEIVFHPIEPFYLLSLFMKVLLLYENFFFKASPPPQKPGIIRIIV